MRLRIASLIILCLVLAAPALGDLAPGYDNGPINGTTDAWTINFGYIVSDTFTGVSYVDFFQFGVWELPGDTLSSVDWSITSAENGGTVYGSGTGRTLDKFLSTNQFGYDIDQISVGGLNVFLDSTKTYWLNLQNASVPSGDPVYWDENSGIGCGGTGGGRNCPAEASQNATGTIASEAFTINSCQNCGPSTPEPGSILLFGSGILGVVGLLRSKLF
jgi:PEP-CTERM motif-containing protein